MPPDTIFRRVSFPFLLLLLLALAAAAILGPGLIRHGHRARLDRTLDSQARLWIALAREPLAQEDTARLEALSALARDSSIRVAFLGPDGRPIAGADRSAGSGEQPELRDAAAEGRGRQVRPSFTEGTDVLYTAFPVSADGKRFGFIRFATPLGDMERRVRRFYGFLGLGSLAFLALAGLAALVAARRLARPLLELQHYAQRIAAGRESERSPSGGPAEVEALSSAVRKMARRLTAERDELRQRHKVQQAVLASMWGAVVAVDRQERILNFNQAAARLFGVDPAAVTGRPLQEVIRNLDLQGFLHRSLQGDEPPEGEVVLRSGTEERFFQAHGSPLKNVEGETIGALAVLNDITTLRRLERLRRDFVANVSHELRTPVTSIRGFVETLREGAMEDPEQAAEFLAIIDRQSARLSAIIEDLLSLSRIEQATDKEEIAFEEYRLAEVLAAAVQTCELKAAGRGIAIEVACPENLTACLNGPLIEQAVINLLDNAVKYSDPGLPVQVSAAEEGAYVFIRVRDQGRGIGREHLARLFERFYRADRGRSRQLGGTGLGLAIVKHIVLAHHGRVTVASEPGRGSTFTLQLPRSRSG